jgi:hypothetical protein
MPHKNLSKITVNKDFITLIFNQNNQRKVFISEIDKVYIKVYKAPKASAFLLLVPILILVYDFYFTILVLIAITTAIVMSKITIKTHKTYEPIMSLKNGESFKKHYKKELKQEYIEITQSIRKEIFLYKIAQNI